MVVVLKLEWNAKIFGFICTHAFGYETISGIMLSSDLLMEISS